MKIDKSNLLWIDMEMTGLDPEKEGIIEIACIVTDKELHILEEGPDIVVSQPVRLLKSMDEWNRKHHEKSGLTAAVRQSKITVKKAEKWVLEFAKKFCVPKKTILCGNAIHHDRRFIIKHMPKLNEFLHYRLIDVSSVKEIVNRWYPKHKELPRKNKAHRALADIRESIEELKFYRKHYFK